MYGPLACDCYSTLSCKEMRHHLSMKAERMSQELLLESLELLRTGNFRPGMEMDKAHQISQAHEGVSDFDWVHALVHRIEGDDANAAYWYRRAGKVRHSGSIEEEWRIIRKEVE